MEPYIGVLRQLSEDPERCDEIHAAIHTIFVHGYNLGIPPLDMLNYIRQRLSLRGYD